MKDARHITFAVIVALGLAWQAAVIIGTESVKEGKQPIDPAAATISKGEAVRLEDYCQEGKWTLFAVTARWSPESLETMHWLEPAAKQRGVLLRKIKIKTLNCEVGDQLDVHHPLPHLRLYDGKKLLSKDPEAIFELVQGKNR